MHRVAGAATPISQPPATGAPLVEAAAELIRSPERVAASVGESCGSHVRRIWGLFKGLLDQYHYLGHRNTGARTCAYLFRDRHGRPVACARDWFGSMEMRGQDRFLGWDRACRERNLQALTNNTRFLDLALGRGLASGQPRPWPYCPAHPGGLAKPSTLIPCTQWKHLWTVPDSKAPASRPRTGCAWAQRGADPHDRDRRIQAPVKDVYLYPAIPEFRQQLCLPVSAQQPVYAAACSRTAGRAGK